ncbi:hypothetical protein ACS0TY_009282 [Phlomoides rotata]
MPSVGMRRSTRVFGARVLRSGRRLWTGAHESIKGPHGENKFPELLDNSADGGGDADDYQKDTWHGNENRGSVGMIAELKTEEQAPNDAVEVKNVDMMRGIVYRRKRKRAKLTSAGLTEDERYGKKFVRKQWRRRASESIEVCGDFRDHVSRSRGLAIVVIGSSYDCGYWIACFLTSVLSYMTRVRIGMRRLSAFLLTNPIFEAYSSHGVLFFQVPNTAKNPGFCIISGSRSSMPLFSVDISAIPSFLVHVQTSISLRSARLYCLLDRHYKKDESVIHVADDDAEELSCQISPWREQVCVSEAPQISQEKEISSSDIAASENATSESRPLSHPSVGIPKSALRNLQLRSSRNIQKRRSSLRRKRGRPPSAFRTQKASGALASDFLRIRHDGLQYSVATPTRSLRSSDKRRTTTNIKELRSTLANKNASSGSCSANLLITEGDKCYRVEGATIFLELSASKQWFIIVSKGGTQRWTLTAQQAMRPPCSNRFTHAVVWAGDGGWKLEFPNKQDWFFFKELYKECSDRNLQSPSASVIPVPRVQEVPIPDDIQFVPFVRPDSYITVKDDELSRALVKTSANYDMDSDDEEWLTKLNAEFNAGKEVQGIITPESFELVIDALEKGFHYNPEENLDEQAVNDFCMNLERREVIEAIHKYWVKKRKQKRSALIRIFQVNLTIILLKCFSVFVNLVMAGYARCVTINLLKNLMFLLYRN